MASIASDGTQLCPVASPQAPQAPQAAIIPSADRTKDVIKPTPILTPLEPTIADS